MYRHRTFYGPSALTTEVEHAKDTAVKENWRLFISARTTLDWTAVGRCDASRSGKFHSIDIPPKCACHSGLAIFLPVVLTSGGEVCIELIQENCERK